MTNQEKILIITVEIPQYIRQVMTTKSRTIKYYEQYKKEIPNKYTIDKYEYRDFPFGKKYKVVLVNKETGEPVIANPRSAGTSKYKIINGQDLHTCRMKDYERAKIINAIKDQMIPIVSKMNLINQFPIIIELEIQDTFNDIIANNQGWDVENRILFYNKVFQDVLSGTPQIDKDIKQKFTTTKVIIPDDNRRYVTGSPGGLFTLIENSEDRKLIYRIYHDQREVIKNSKYYQ